MQPIGQCDVSKSANGQEMHAYVKKMLTLTFSTGEFTSNLRPSVCLYPGVERLLVIPGTGQAAVDLYEKMAILGSDGDAKIRSGCQHRGIVARGREGSNVIAECYKDPDCCGGADKGPLATHCVTHQCHLSIGSAIKYDSEIGVIWVKHMQAMCLLWSISMRNSTCFV
jgi:hypothetical protein